VQNRRAVPRAIMRLRKKYKRNAVRFDA